MYPLAVYLKCLLVGNMISTLFFNGTAKAAAEAGAAVASVSSDLDKKFRFHYDEKEGREGKETHFYFLPLYLEVKRRMLLVKNSLVGNFYGT